MQDVDGSEISLAALGVAPVNARGLIMSLDTGFKYQVSGGKNKKARFYAVHHQPIGFWIY